MKKLLPILGIPLAVMIFAIIALVTFVNPNQFKPLITEQVYKHTGLELAIKGDIQWSFFPSLGFELGHTVLINPAGFSTPNLLEVNQVGVQVAVKPLFAQQLQIGNVSLDGAKIHIETLANGQSNLDLLTQKPAETKPVTELPVETNTVTDQKNAEQQEFVTNQWPVSLAGIMITNAALDIVDHRSESTTKLYDVALSLNDFTFDTWTPITFAASGEKKPQEFTLKGSAQFKLANSLTEYAVKNVALEATFADGVNKFNTLKLNLDQFIPASMSQVDFEVKGQAADLNVEAKGSSAVMLNKELTKVTLDKLLLDANLRGSSLPQSPLKVALDSKVNIALDTLNIQVVLNKLMANQLQFDGDSNITLSDIPKIRFNLHSPNIDLDDLLGLTKEKQASSDNSQSTVPPTNKKQSSTVEIEPDLSVLKTLDVKGTLAIDKFKANNAHLQNIKMSLKVNKGIASVSSFTANLYKGSISANGQLDARKSPASFSVTKKIKGVQVQPLLKDVIDNDKLQGTGNIDVNVKGKGLTPTSIKKSLVGTAKIKFADGAVNGINVAQMIRDGYAKIKGKSLDGVKEPQKTDFSALTADMQFKSGVVSTNNVLLQSPLLRITGKGNANYIKESMDMLIRTSVVGSLKGQGGKNIDELKDVTVPINVSGSWTEPKFKLVFDDLLKKKAEKEVQRGVEKLTDKIKDEKTKKAVDGLLKGLFN